MKLHYILFINLICLLACNSTKNNEQNKVKILSEEELDNAEIYSGFTEADAVPKDSVFWISIKEDQKGPLERLPEKLLQYPHLQVLMIKYSSLKELTPNVLKKLINLQELYLSNNDLEQLPKEIGELKYLTYLDIQGNGIKEFPKEMTQLKKLKEIRINYTPISEASLKMMLEAVPDITIYGIEHVVVDSMYFTRTEEEWMHLMDSIHQE